MGLVQDLLNNEEWSFWKSDWSGRIIVLWPKSVNRKSFFGDVEKKVGKNFIYERTLSGPAKYKATKKGLIKYNANNR